MLLLVTGTRYKGVQYEPSLSNYFVRLSYSYRHDKVLHFYHSGE